MTTPSNPPRALYAPDLFSEHARLAQLGARVLEILREHAAGSLYPAGIKVFDAARSLGLLDAEGGAK